MWISSSCSAAELALPTRKRFWNVTQTCSMTSNTSVIFKEKSRSWENGGGSRCFLFRLCTCGHLPLHFVYPDRYLLVSLFSPSNHRFDNWYQEICKDHCLLAGKTLKIPFDDLRQFNQPVTLSDLPPAGWTSHLTHAPKNLWPLVLTYVPATQLHKLTYPILAQHQVTPNSRIPRVKHRNKKNLGPRLK